ncbi:hypothetical protein F4703DRAFT_1899534 [Phycomyces blakesleeanus]
MQLYEDVYIFDSLISGYRHYQSSFTSYNLLFWLYISHWYDQNSASYVTYLGYHFLLAISCVCSTHIQRQLSLLGPSIDLPALIMSKPYHISRLFSIYSLIIHSIQTLGRKYLTHGIFLSYSAKFSAT